MDALKLFMENSRFKRSWYAYKDTDGENRTFAEKVGMLGETPLAKDILEWINQHIPPKGNADIQNKPAKSKKQKR